MAIFFVFAAIAIACFLGLRAMERRPHWDAPTDVGARWALRTGVVVCPIIAVLGPFIT